MPSWLGLRLVRRRARTPNLDALAARGTRFARTYSQHSACSQSRIAMMTGWYPHVAGHRTLDHLLQPWEPNLLASLKAAGYHVAWAGIRGDTFAPGVTEASTDFFGYLVRPDLGAVAAAHREAFPEGHPLHHSHYLGRIEEGIARDEAAVRTAVELLTRGMPEPWILYVTLIAPHPPFAVSEPWFSMHDRRDMPAPLTAGSGKPAFMDALRSASGLEQLGVEDWAEITATYYGMVSKIDDQLGRVLGAVDACGATDRTVTCFFTDHGEYLGDFGLVEKWPSGLDDCLLRNPLVIAGPGVREGQVHEGLVEMIDLVPTLCELAETEVGHGPSDELRPLLEDASRTHRDAAFSEGGFRLDEAAQNEQVAGGHYALKTTLLQERPELVGRAVAIRTDRWTFVHRRYDDDELYDRADDPAETSNVAGRPEHSSLVTHLRERILDWLVDTSDVIRLDRDPRMEPALFDQLVPPEIQAALRK